MAQAPETSLCHGPAEPAGCARGRGGVGAHVPRGRGAVGHPLQRGHRQQRPAGCVAGCLAVLGAHGEPRASKGPLQLQLQLEQLRQGPRASEGLGPTG